MTHPLRLAMMILFGAACVATVVTFTGPTRAGDDHPSYQLDADWPNYPADMQFEMGSGVAVDADGIVYLFTRDIEHWAAHPLAMKEKMGKSSVSMFDSDGKYLGKWGPSDDRGFALGAHTMYIDQHGKFWFADRDGHTVKRYDADGTLLVTLGTFAKPGDGPDQLNGPTAVVVQANGNYVVADGYWNSRLMFYAPDGSFIKSVGKWGRGPGEFNSVHAMAQTADGRLLVVDFCGGNLHPYMTVPGQIAEYRTVRDPDCKGRIQVLDAEGNYLDEWTSVNPLSVAVYGDKVYASDNMSNLAILDDQTGEVIDRIDGLAIYIHQMALSPRGDIYVASVYPEHRGFKRGIHGPTHRRWERLDQ
jgi:DNA-binding beta-propeller fold protein YncE